MNKKIKLCSLLALSFTTLAANAAHLEGIHGNQRWVEHPGSAFIKIYNGDSTKVIRSAKCDAQLLTDYQTGAETGSNDQAYFVLETLDECTVKKNGYPGFFDLPVSLSIGNSLFAPFTVDLKLLSEGKGTYRDGFFSGSYIYTSTDTTVKEVTHINGDVTSVTQITRAGDQLTFSHQDKYDGRVLKEVTGTFQLNVDPAAKN